MAKCWQQQQQQRQRQQITSAHCQRCTLGDINFMYIARATWLRGNKNKEKQHKLQKLNKRRQPWGVNVQLQQQQSLQHGAGKTKTRLWFLLHCACQMRTRRQLAACLMPPAACRLRPVPKATMLHSPLPSVGCCCCCCCNCLLLLPHPQERAVVS